MSTGAIRPLSAEVDEQIRLALRKAPTRSNASIARELGVSGEPVRKRRRDLELAGEIEPQNTRVDSIGRLQRLDVAAGQDLDAALATRLADCAKRGLGIAEMVDETGMTRKKIRLVAQSYGVSIPRARGIRSERVVSETVIGLEGLATGVAMIKGRLDELVDHPDLEYWIESLDVSLASIERMRRGLTGAKLRGDE